jgi:two-component system sensor histidine kinase KdpD
MVDFRSFPEVLISINAISSTRRISFEQKLHHILFEIATCMRARNGSIMLVKGRKTLKVVASRNPELIGVEQRLDENSPSAWVFRNRRHLYVDNTTGCDLFPRRFDHYEGRAFLLTPILANDRVVGILSLTDKEGADLFTTEEQEVLLSISGGIIGALETERLAEALKKKRQALHKKNQELRRLQSLKADLFNMLIHDLKGPISELMANLDILSYTMEEKNQEYVDGAKAGCDTLYSMVSNLLDIARLEEGRLDLIHEKIDPRDLIKESLARLFGLARMKGLAFIERFSEKEDFLWADRGLLLRVLQNLLSNAIDYSPPGEKIEVGFEYLVSPEVEFFVKDNGPGVPEEFREAIFDKYFQIQKETDGRIYTVGLGLTFCKMAVEAHRGTIRAEKGSTEGSRFSFVLPLHRKGGR